MKQRVWHSIILFCLIVSVVLLSSSLLGKQDENVTSPNPPPQATLTADPTEGVPPLTVTFTAEATDVDLQLPEWAKGKSFKDTASIEIEVEGEILSYEWDFGDGNTATTEEEETSHTYEQAQEDPYEAKVTVKCDDLVGEDGENEKAEATATVTVSTPSLWLTADPASIPVSTEEEQSTSTLTIQILDANGEEVTDVSYTVNLTLSDDNLGSLDSSTITVEGEAEVTFTAGNQSGCELITASGEGLNTAYTNINVHEPLSSVEVTPDSATLHIGESEQFTAKGYDAQGTPVSNLTFTWSGGEEAGTLSNDGLFTATTLSDWQTITATETQTSISGDAQVKVVTPLHHITVTPDPVTLKVGDSESFTATGYDDQNNVVPIEPTWSVTGNIGTIDSAGNFTATTLGTGSVTATASGITGSASVTVGGDGDQAPTVDISADPSALEPGTNTTITVTVRRGDEPESGVSVSLTASAVNQSGGHQHNSNRPINTPNPSTGTTGSDGKFSSSYTTTAFGGQETITATAAGKTASVSLDVRVPGLSQLTTGTGYELTGSYGQPGVTSKHIYNHYGTSKTIKALKGIAKDFEKSYPAEPDLGYNDMSLKKGGLFDIGNNWKPDHSAHRRGKNCDLDNIDEGMGHLDKLKDFIEGVPYNGDVDDHGDHWHLTFQ